MAGHEATLRHEESRGLKKGRKARIDSTVVEMNIHLPTYSTLLQEGIRIITRWLAEGRRKVKSCPSGLSMLSLSLREGAVFGIQQGKKKAIREKAYKNLCAFYPFSPGGSPLPARRGQGNDPS
jgi:IS5 family transposase